MGIDAFLFADHPKDNKDQKELAYIRESYGFSPYPSRALLRDAYESETCVAQIPASIMRERLTNVTEPYAANNRAHNFVLGLQQMFQDAGILTDGSAPYEKDQTAPATVEEMIQARNTNCGNLPEQSARISEQYYKFVEAAEEFERVHGRPAFVYVWY